MTIIAAVQPVQQVQTPSVRQSICIELMLLDLRAARTRKKRSTGTRKGNNMLTKMVSTGPMVASVPTFGVARSPVFALSSLIS
mmetsp:Transcript_135544/g.433610  ORF Transcript_135544/g.433610 Transcript_135544/m.433610 type:complete len:83 (-) Transcript_135544:233-481(-)